MKDSLIKLTIQSLGLLIVIGIAFVTSGFPFLLAVGISLLLLAAHKETSKRNKIFSWAGSFIFIAACTLIVVYLVFFSTSDPHALLRGIFPFDYAIPRWLRDWCYIIKL